MSFTSLPKDPLKAKSEVQRALDNLDTKLHGAVRKALLAQANAQHSNTELQQLEKRYMNRGENSHDEPSATVSSSLDVQDTHETAQNGIANAYANQPPPEPASRLGPFDVAVAVGVLVAVWVLDSILFAAVSRHFAAMLWNSPAFESFAQFVMPAVFVCIDLWISNMRLDAQVASLHGGGGPALTFWTVVAALFGLVMPSAVAATLLAAFGSQLFGFAIPLLVCLLLLSFVSHLVLLFGGAFILQNLEETLFHLRRWSRRVSARKAERQSAVSSDIPIALFKQYHRRLALWNELWDDSNKRMRLQPHIFTSEVREFVNQHLGYELLPSPEVSGSPAADGQGSPQPAIRPQSGGGDNSHPRGVSPEESSRSADGVEEYLRRIMRCRIAEEESELKPDINRPKE